MIKIYFIIRIELLHQNILHLSISGNFIINITPFWLNLALTHIKIIVINNKLYDVDLYENFKLILNILHFQY